MKQLAIIILGLVACTVHAQTIRIANNNPGAGGGKNVYTGKDALRNAFAAASAGDIIHVVPSSVSYGNLKIDKSITIYGVGIRPPKALGAKSIVGNQIEIDADNVTLSGLTQPYYRNFGLGFVLAKNSKNKTIKGITIENCRFHKLNMSKLGGNVSNLLVRNNVIGQGHITLATTSNALITNNILINVSGVTATNATFQYNVFADNSTSNFAYDGLVNCTLDHNIFYGKGVNVGRRSPGNSWTNNLSFGNSRAGFNKFNTTTFGNTGSGNKENQDPMFVNFTLENARGWSDSYDLSLKAGSPAKNHNGNDIGITGGNTPFDADGNLLPLIQSISIPAVIKKGDKLPVTIKAKGN